MSCALIFYPPLSAELSESIDAIRREYDPTRGLIKPHITAMFPTGRSIGEEPLIRHIQSVLSDWSPFRIRLGGFHKSRDHWLFLTLKEGENRFKELHQTLYKGILSQYRSDVDNYIPHIGLGLFMKAGTIYDWRNPRESDFDRQRYEKALRQAKELPLQSSILVEKLVLTRIPNEFHEWTTGKRASIPEDSQVVEVREFRLGHQGA